MPLQVVDIDTAAAVGIAREFKDLSFDAGFIGIKPWALRFKEGGLVIFVLLALYRVRGANQTFKAQSLEVLGKEAGKVAPLRIVARQ